MLQVPSTHRFSATATKIAANLDKAKQRPQKDDEAEELFHAVKKAALSEEQRSIKLLLEQGIAKILTSSLTSSDLKSDIGPKHTSAHIFSLFSSLPSIPPRRSNNSVSCYLSRCKIDLFC